MNETVRDSTEAWLEPSQRAIVPELRSWLAGEWRPAEVRISFEDHVVVERRLLGSAPRADWLVPLASGRPVTDAVVIAHEWGRVLAPPVLIDVNVAADTLVRANAVPRLVERLAAGRELVAWCGNELPGHEAPGRRTGRAGEEVRVADDAGGLVVNGRQATVQCIGHAKQVLVAARDGDGITLLLVPREASGVSHEPLECLDLARQVSTISFDDVRISPDSIVGGRRAGGPLVERQARLSALLASACIVGAGEAILQTALTDAGERSAFGRRVGSFQAVKHQLVDASLALEICRAFVARAALAVAEGEPDADEIVSATKAYVGRAGVDIAHIAWQVLGGKAYMWDADFHLFLRRITVDSAWYGDVDAHEQRIWSLHDRARATA